MFNIPIKDLEDLKLKIIEIKEEQKSDTGKVLIKNTPEFQTALDLLVNMPLSESVNSNEIYQFQSSSIWVQMFSPDSKRKLMQATHVPFGDKFKAIYTVDSDNDKFYEIEYLDHLEKDCPGNIKYLSSSELGGGGYTEVLLYR